MNREGEYTRSAEHRAGGGQPSVATSRHAAGGHQEDSGS